MGSKSCNQSNNCEQLSDLEMAFEVMPEDKKERYEVYTDRNFQQNKFKLGLPELYMAKGVLQREFAC